MFGELSIASGKGPDGPREDQSMTMSDTRNFTPENAFSEYRSGIPSMRRLVRIAGTLILPARDFRPAEALCQIARTEF
jgi:hypothetical protein